MDFVGSPVSESLPANSGDSGLTVVQEDSTCLRAAKPVHHNYRAHQSQLEKTQAQRQGPCAAENKLVKYLKKKEKARSDTLRKACEGGATAGTGQSSRQLQEFHVVVDNSPSLLVGMQNGTVTIETG